MNGYFVRVLGSVMFFILILFFPRFAFAQNQYCINPELPQFSDTSHGEIVKIAIGMSRNIAEIQARKTDNSNFQQNGTMEIWDNYQDHGTRRVRSRTYNAGEPIIYDSLNLDLIGIGIHSLYARFLPSTGGEYWTSTVVAIIIEALHADFSASPLSGEAPLRVAFENRSTGTIWQSVWEFGDNTISSQTNPVHQYDAPGTYTVSLRVYGLNQCGITYHTKNNYIQVLSHEEEPLTLNVDFTASPREGELPISVQFTSQISGNVTVSSYSWDFGDGTTSQERNPRHLYSASGSYSVTFTASGQGVSDTERKQGYILVQEPRFLEVDFNAYNQRGRVPLNVRFSSSVRTNVTVSSYEWDFGDGSRGTGISPEHWYIQAGIYTVTLTASGEGLIDTETKPGFIIVEGEQIPPPCAFFTVEPRQGERPHTVFFQATCDASTITSYLWDFGNGDTATTREGSYTYERAGIYDVRLRVQGPSGEDFLLQDDYIEVTDPEFSLHFPILSKTPWTAVINAVFDHSMESPYTADFKIVPYTGEGAWLPENEDPQTSENASYVITINDIDLYGFRDLNDRRFQINGHYSGDNFLYYDGHPGYDYKTIDQHPEGLVSVYAAFGGKVVFVGGQYGTVKIDHLNGYTTVYMHCSEIFVQLDQYVRASSLIATAGDIGTDGRPHFHFEVRYQGIPVDPYGWRGIYPDPYRIPNVVLWHTAGGGMLTPPAADVFQGEPLDSAILLSWSYNHQPDNLAGFFLYFDYGNGFEYLSTLEADIQTFTATDLDNGVEYAFRLTSFNEINEESEGKVIYLTPQAPEEDEVTTEESDDDDDSAEEEESPEEDDSDDENEDEQENDENTQTNDGEVEGETDNSKQNTPQEIEVNICGKTENGDVNVCGISSTSSGAAIILALLPLMLMIVRYRFQP